MINTLYKLCLHLYPSQFRDDFGDEMLGVFVARMNDIDGHLNQADALFTEVIDMMWSAFNLHSDIKKAWYNSLSDEVRTLIQARWIIRVASLLIALFFVVVTLEPYAKTPEPENLVFLVFFSIQLMSVFFALRWERAGGIILLTTTFTIAPIIFFGTAHPGLELYSFVASLLWTIPFGGFAMAYLILGYRQQTVQNRKLV